MRVEFGTARLFPWLLLALVSLLYLSDLSGRDLWEPNEPTYAEAAREMAVRGDWLLPTVNGETYPDKPPLLFWGIELASSPEGKVTETTARLPSALAGAALVLAIYFLSRRDLRPLGALLAAATLAVSNLYAEQARYVQTDMLLSLGIGVGILSLFRVLEGESPRIGWVLLSALGLGMGILAKGPIALALPALVMSVDFFFERYSLRQVGGFLLASLLALVIPVLYYLDLLRWHGATTLKEFLLRDNVERFVAGFDNLQPWWFYLKHTPVDLLPMTLLLPAAAFFRPWNPGRRRFHRRLWIWLLVFLAFFSLSTSKRPVYMLPAFPAAALLCGSLLERAAEWQGRRSVKRWALLGQGAALAFLAIAGIVAPILAGRKAPELLRVTTLLTLLAIVGSLLGFREMVRQRYAAAQGILITVMAGVWLVSIFYIYPDANRLNSPRFFAQEIRHLVPTDAPLDSYGLYRWRSGYVFYAQREIPRLRDVSAVEQFLESGQRVFCLLPEDRLSFLRARVAAPFYLVAEGGAGHHKDCLVSNRPPA